MTPEGHAPANPARLRQLQELDQVELCVRILTQSRNELYVNMPFLDLPLSSLALRRTGAGLGWRWMGSCCTMALIFYFPSMSGAGCW